MMKNTMAVVLLVGLVSMSAYAVPDSGIVDFNDGTKGELSLIRQIQREDGTWLNPSASEVVPGGDDRNIAGGESAQALHFYDPTQYGFDQAMAVLDRNHNGLGDMYGDVTVTTLYSPDFINENSESALSVRIQRDTGWGYGIRCGPAYVVRPPFMDIPVALGYSRWTTVTGNPVPFYWDSDGSNVETESGVWYEISLSAVGTSLTGSIKKLDGDWNVVDTAYAAMSMTGGEECPILTEGLVGLRPASNLGNFFIDNYSWDGDLKPAPIAGDLNADGFVGGDDLNIILGAWGSELDPEEAGYWPLGDPSGDGFVGGDDLNLVLGNWGASAPSMGDVPEPTTMCLLVIGVIGALGRRRRHVA